MKYFTRHWSLILFKKLFPALLIYLLPLKSHSQSNDEWYLSKILNDNSGMPQNTISSMYFDKETGFLWMTTEAGIVRYNGIDISVFDKRLLPRMKNVRMKSFYRSIKDGVFAVDKDHQAYLIHKAGVNMITDGDKEILIPDLFEGNFADLEQADQINNHTEQDFTSEEKRTGAYNLSQYPSAVLNVNDSVWVSYSSGYILLFNRKKRIAAWPKAENERLVLMNNGDQVFALNRQGEYFFIDTKKISCEKLQPTDSVFNREKAVIFYDKMNSQPLILDSNRLYGVCFSGKQISTRLIAVLQNLPRNISSIVVHPDSRKIFIGTSLNGLSIYSKSIFRTYSAKGNFKIVGNRESDRSNIYATVLTDSTHLLTSTSVLFNLDNGSYSFLPFKIERPQALMFADNKYVWYGYADSILNFEYGSRSINKVLPIGVPQMDSALKNFLQCFYEAKNGRKWVSTHDFLGYIEKNSIVKTSFFKHSPQTSLTFITESGSGKLYGANNIGFYTIDTSGNQIMIIQDERVLAKDIRFLYIDSLERCWMTTYGSGIYMYDLKSHAFYNLPSDSKGYLLFSHSLCEDGRGNFLIPTNKGLFRISINHLLNVAQNPKQHLLYQYFDVSTGLESNEFNGGCMPAFNRMASGDILFPSLVGLVRVKQKELPEIFSYPIFVSAIETSDTVYNYIENTNKELNFKASERLQTWIISVAQWGQTGSSGISYKLDDDDWIYLQDGVYKIQVTNLDGGAHKLLIRAQAAFSADMVTAVTFKFYIEKKFYEKLWFWLVVAGALAIIIYQSATLRSTQLRRKNLLLEKKIHSKTVEIKIKNTDLEETLSNLNIAMKHLEQTGKFQRNLIGVLGHDIMIPLQYIAKVSTQIINYRQKLSIDTTIEAVSDIGNTASQLLYMGESVIQWIKIQEGHFVPVYQSFKVFEMVENMFHLHKHMSEEKKNKMINDVAKDFYCVQEPIIAKIILHNLLLNANKFTTNGTITVSVKSTPKQFQLIVQDSGMGMDEDFVNKLNNMIAVRPMWGTEKELGWGLGYMLIIDLVKFIHAKLFIESFKGKGTSVTISFNQVNSIRS